MSDQKLRSVDLRREQQTMLMTLYLHARDARSAHPVLGDDVAVGILDRIEYDEAPLARLRGNQPLIVGRAKAIDAHVRTLLDRHSDAVVLHLGCGLDSRVRRIDPPKSVAWVEVDQAPVVDLRRRLYPERDGVTTVAASVTDSGWWAAVPTRRPLLVVAEGLFMYLTPAQVATVCDLVAGHDARNTTVIADSVAGWVKRIAGRQSSMRQASTGFSSTSDDLERGFREHPRFTTVTRTSLVSEAARAAPGMLGRGIGLLDRLPAGHRAMTLTVRQDR